MRAMAAAALAAIALGACSTARGGGTLPSAADPNKTANFGFTAACDAKKQTYKVQISYQDLPSNGLILQGWASGPAIVLGNGGCEVNMNGDYDFEYDDPHTKGKPDGTGNFLWEDHGPAGPSAEDYIEIDITSGPYDYYFNEGELLSGNVQMGTK